jgi:MtN3 and saliva related transmembrane protein
MPAAETVIGLAAAFCTTVSYLPQVHKSWKTRSTADLSMQMMLLLASGLLLWIIYGALRGDVVLIVANSIGLSLLSSLIVLKSADLAGHLRPHQSARNTTRDIAVDDHDALVIGR